MKTLSGTLKLVMLLGIGASAVFTFRALAQTPSAPRYAGDKKFVLRITKEAQFKNGNEAAFNKALKELSEDQYLIDVTRADGTLHHYPPAPKLSIKTDKVTTSEVAKSAQAGKFTPIGSNVTQHLTSDSATAITDVLNTLQ